MAQGKFALVEQHLEKAFHLDFSSIGEHEFYALLVEAAVLQRNEEPLRKYAPLLEKEASELDHPLFRAISHRGWGVLHTLQGDFNAAEKHLNQALAQFQTLETNWQLGRTHFELGTLDTARSDKVAAWKHYSRALKLFETLGAVPDAARTRAILDTML